MFNYHLLVQEEIIRKLCWLMIFEQQCIFNATKYLAHNLIRTLMNICTKFKSTKKSSPPSAKVKHKKLFETSLKIFKHYKLKPSFSIIKDEKDKVGVGGQAPTQKFQQFEQVWSNLFQFDQVWSNLIQINQIRSSLIQIIPIWSSFIQFDQVLSNLFQFDQVWSNLIKFDPIRSS